MPRWFVIKRAFCVEGEAVASVCALLVERHSDVGFDPVHLSTPIDPPSPSTMFLVMGRLSRSRHAWS